MNLQRIADALQYKKDRCEHCYGWGQLAQRDANGIDAWTASGACLCRGRGYLWYPTQDPALPRPFLASLTDEQLLERWQQSPASQQP
jgi:hypothetical protein